MTKLTVAHILNALRQATVTWHLRAEVLRLASKEVIEGQFKNGRPKIKRYFQCRQCQRWFRDQSALEVDHIEEVGSFDGSFDRYISRLFCGIENLQALCIPCHSKKTQRSARERWQRKTVLEGTEKTDESHTP